MGTIHPELDNFTSQRHANIWGHPGHYPVDPYTSPWSTKGHSHGQEGPSHMHLFNVNWQPPYLNYVPFKIWPWNSKVKVMAKAKHDIHICGQEINRYVWFPLRGNWTIFGWKSKFYIWPWKCKIKSWPRGKLMVTFEAWALIDTFIFRFVAKLFWPFFIWDIANSVLNLENSRSRSQWKSTKM